MLALVLCTSERWTATGHICCWGPSAHQSHGAGLGNVLHHQLMLFCERNPLVIGAKSNKCHTIVLALMFNTSERCTFSQATPVMQLVSSQMKQWLLSLNLQFSTSTDDVRWTYWVVLALLMCTSKHCGGSGHTCCCRSHAQSMYHSMKRWLIMRSIFMMDASCFVTTLWQPSAPYAASVTYLCLHKCSAHLSAIL